jgi:UDP-GlcNAc:undecaprenyl-phosphate/decaprenyl-phosphate GlcNAc-1-phosphate transferase
MSRALDAVALGAVAAISARAAYAGLRRRPPAGEMTWTRTNHRGELVTLLEGPAASVGAIAAELIGARTRGFRPARSMALAGAGALAFGLLDDLAGSGKRRGLRGHLGALAHGEITTGTVKLGGLAATGLAAAAAGDTVSDGAVDVIINAGLIAGGANLLNLFDLRPGRALKVAVLSGGLIAVVSGDPVSVAPVLGASLALLPEDLGERAMLGDAGANALGSMLGAAAARSLPRPARIGLLAGIAALTLASEKISFTAFIERTPPLRRLDMLGRRPVRRSAPPLIDAGAGSLEEVTQPPRQRMGRHRRVASGVGRVRSVTRFLEFFFRTPARSEP